MKLGKSTREAFGLALAALGEQQPDLVVVDAPPTGQIASYLRAPRSIAELVATGRIRSQSDWMESTLANPELTQLVLVTLPEELPTTETVETIGWVTDTKVVGAPTVITNRVLEEIRVKTPEGVAGEMVTLHKSLWTEQQEWLHRLPPDLILPHLFGLFTPGEVAAHLSDVLEVLT